MRNPIAVMSISVFCGLAALVGIFHAMWKDYSSVYTLIYVLLAAGFIITGILAGVDVAHLKHKAEVYLDTLEPTSESEQKATQDLLNRIQQLEETIATSGIVSPNQTDEKAEVVK